MAVQGKLLFYSSLVSKTPLINIYPLGLVSPDVEIFDFEEINEVIVKLSRFEIQGRVVLKIPQENN